MNPSVPARRLRAATTADQPRLLTIWEAAVHATHDFLEAADVAYYRDFVPAALGLLNVWLVEQDDTIVGFVGWRDRRIEMLFVTPQHHCQGIGRQLLQFLFDSAPTSATWSVEVNEDNHGARRFYRHCGFVQTHRTALDHGGRPFPLLYLRREGTAAAANAPQRL